MSAIKLRIKIIVKAIFHALFGRTRLKAWILRVFSRDYELDSAKLAELIAKPLAKDAPKGDFIATLTSFPARIGILKYALHSIFSQDLRAKKVVLVLSVDEFAESNKSAESSLDSALPLPSISLDSSRKKGCTPLPAPPTRQKAAAFSLLGGVPRFSASSKKSALRSSAPFDSDFLHHEAGEFKGASHDSFLDSANLDSLLPSDILAFKKYGLEILWTAQNLRQYNKIIPILRAFPNENIITLDDDIYYNSRTFSTLYAAHLSNKRVIWAHKARIVPFNSTKIADFFEWKIIRKRHKKSQNLPRFNIFLEGCGGVLYPPNCLYKDAQDCAKFMRLAPKADDIWLWAMAILKGTKIACVKPPLMGDGAAFTNSASNTALWHYNMNGGNDRQMRAILKEYPQILRILAQEKEQEKADEKMSKKAQAGEKS